MRVDLQLLIQLPLLRIQGVVAITGWIYALNSCLIASLHGLAGGACRRHETNAVCGGMSEVNTHVFMLLRG